MCGQISDKYLPTKTMNMYKAQMYFSGLQIPPYVSQSTRDLIGDLTKYMAGSMTTAPATWSEKLSVSVKQALNQEN